MKPAGGKTLAVAAIVALVTGIPTVAAAQPGKTAPASVRGSIAYLVDRYGVSESEALRRLDLQRVSLSWSIRIPA